MTNEPIEVDPQHPRLAATIAPPPSDAPEPPAAAPPPMLVGRARLQAAIDAASARTLTRRRAPTRTSDARAQTKGAAEPTGDDNQRLYELFKTEGWEVMKEWLQAREAALLAKLRNPSASLEEMRVWQGSLYEIAGLLAEEGRINSIMDKEPEPLPEDAQAIAQAFAPPSDLSHVQQGRAP